MAEKYEYDYFNVTFPKEYVAHVEINRPEKLNAFFEQMWINIRQIFSRLSHDPNVRAIVLTAAGDRAFTAGLDVQAASQGSTIGPSTKTDAARNANRLRRHILEFQECISALEKCEKPIITLLHGISFGLAVDMSLCTDVRICVQDARISVKEIDIGLAADIGTLSRLPKAVGSMSWVKDVCLTARIFGAEEALRVGFVSKVVASKREGVEEALAWAETVARKSPVAAMSTKELINYSRDHSVEDGLKYTAIWNASMLQTKDVQDAMLSGLKKRTPTFEKL